jgi:hypothetical protein
MQEYLSTDCLAILENFDDTMAMSSSDDNQLAWYQRNTAINLYDDMTHELIDTLTPFSVIVFTFIVYFITGTVWPVVLLVICTFVICRCRRWFESHICSKAWRWNVFLFFHRQLKSDCQWIWRDGTCVNTYGYCMSRNAISVPLNMPEILLQETHTISIAIMLDIPQYLTDKHLRTRLHTSTSRSHVITTRLMLWSQSFRQASMGHLPFVERWYTKMNIPMIKISQLSEKLDHDAATGDIEWNKHSISVLLEAIEQAIQQRRLPCSKIDESLMPWQIARDSRLFRI